MDISMSVRLYTSHILYKRFYTMYAPSPDTAIKPGEPMRNVRTVFTL